MLGHDSCTHRIERRLDRDDLQHREEAPLAAALNRGGPGVASGGLGTALDVERIGNTFPDGLALDSLADRNSLGEGGAAGVRRLHDLLHLIHAAPIMLATL